MGLCRWCHRRAPISEQGACRLCLESARLIQGPGRTPDLDAGTRNGLQLFFANLPSPPQRRSLPPKPQDQAEQSQPVSSPRWLQPTLFDLAPDTEALRAQATAQARQWAWRTDGIVFERAERFGWSKRQTNQVRRTLKMLQILYPEASVLRASEVIGVRGSDADGNVRSTLEVLEDAGLLLDDRVPGIERYFAGKFSGLPAPMQAQLELWFQTMIYGSLTPPRRKARDPATVRVQILGIQPIITRWAQEGVESLAEVTPEMIQAAMPPETSKRHWVERGLRSLFAVLKSRRALFLNPTRGMTLGEPRHSVPQALDAEEILTGLNSPEPAIAAAVALVAFHGLSNLQLRRLQLTDIIDGRLMLNGRMIPLAAPVRVRLRAWLDERAKRWPRTLNPHLFITQHTAPRLGMPGHQFPWRKAGISAQALRTDRILQEAQASGGDVRRICDLFGLTVDSATRYIRAIE